MDIFTHHQVRNLLQVMEKKLRKLIQLDGVYIARWVAKSSDLKLKFLKM